VPGRTVHGGIGTVRRTDCLGLSIILGSQRHRLIGSDVFPLSCHLPFWNQNSIAGLSSLLRKHQTYIVAYIHYATEKVRIINCSGCAGKRSIWGKPISIE
jgi:hypothetical protein